MYHQADTPRGARRLLDTPAPADPAAAARSALARVRKLLGHYLPGMAADPARLGAALSAGRSRPDLEAERHLALGWLSWLEGDADASERHLATAVECARGLAPAEEVADAALPPLEPGALLARSAYWAARVGLRRDPA